MNPKTLLFMELPPPIHGMTYINQIIYNNLKDEPNYYFFDTNLTIGLTEVGDINFKKIFKNISIMFGAWRVFFSINPDKVYSLLSASKFGIIRDFMINLPAILFNKELILHLHGFTYYKIYESSRLYKLLFYLMSRNSKLIVLCQQQKSETLRIMDKKSYVLYNCLNENISISSKIKNKTLRVCYISNISKKKGTFDLIQAIKNTNKNIELVIAGNFLDDKDEFLELIKESKNIFYLGFADEKRKKEILESSDIFCLPSRLEEGSPISIIEAMSYGLPIIATDKGCIKEMAEDVGYILENNFEYKEILNALDFIDNDYDRLSVKAFEKYKQNYLQCEFIANLKDILGKGN